MKNYRRTCDVEGCDREHDSFGLCGLHYQRVKRWGSLVRPPGARGRRPQPRRECSIEACTGQVKARGWCSPHYERWRKHGDPLGGRPRRMTGASLRERFDAKWELDETTGCWRWTSATVKHGGYGHMSRNKAECPPDGRGGRNIYAHRLAYELYVGPIPKGMTVDHLCRNTVCVNPDHLEAVSGGENTARALFNAYERELLEYAATKRIVLPS